MSMDTDEWRQKREALIHQLRDLEAGRMSHWDEGGGRRLEQEYYRGKHRAREATPR